MAGATLETLNAALEETWTQKTIAEQLYNANPLLERVRRVNSTKVGKYARTAVHTGRNTGFTALPAGGGDLNAAGNQTLNEAEWKYCNFHQQVLIQGEAIDGTTSDTLSVVQAVDLEISGALDDLNRQLTRMLFADGSGHIATMATNSTSGKTLTLNSTEGAYAISRGWLTEGMSINIGTSSDPDSVAAGTEITAVDESTPSITIDKSVTTTTSNYVSLIGSLSSSGTSNEMNGLRNVIGTDKLGDIDPADVRQWQSDVDDTSQALSLALMYERNRKIAQVTGKPSNYVLTSLKQQEAFYKLVQAQVRFAGDQGLAAGNVDGVKFNGMSVYAQPDCPDEYMAFLTIENLLTVTAGDPYWQNKVTGGKILEWIQGTDGYGAKLTTRMNLGCNRRNSLTALSNLS